MVWLGCCFLEWMGEPRMTAKKFYTYVPPKGRDFNILIPARLYRCLCVFIEDAYSMLIQEFTELDKIGHNNFSLAWNSGISVYAFHFLITSFCHRAHSEKTDQSFSYTCVHITYWFKNYIVIFIHVYFFFPQAVIHKSDYKIKYATRFDLKISHYKANN